MDPETLCQCGHEAQDHHRSFFPGASDWYIEECEFYGWNEHGGAMYDELTGRWVAHCDRFKLPNPNCDGSHYDNGCRCVDCVLRYSC